MTNNNRLKNREKQRRLRVNRFRKSGKQPSEDQRRQYAENRANLLMAGDLLAALKGLASMPAASDMIEVIRRGGAFRKVIEEVINRDLSHSIQWLQAFQQVWLTVERPNAKGW